MLREKYPNGSYDPGISMGINDQNYLHQDYMLMLKNCTFCKLITKTRV